MCLLSFHTYVKSLNKSHFSRLMFFKLMLDLAGYWIFHCHIEFHVEVGMSLVFKVGEHDQMPPVPLQFPECGNYMPDLYPTPVCEDRFHLMSLLPFISSEHCKSQASLHTSVYNFRYIFIIHTVFWLYCKSKLFST